MSICRLFPFLNLFSVLKLRGSMRTGKNSVQNIQLFAAVTSSFTFLAQLKLLWFGDGFLFLLLLFKILARAFKQVFECFAADFFYAGWIILFFEFCLLRCLLLCLLPLLCGYRLLLRLLFHPNSFENRIIHVKTVL